MVVYIKTRSQGNAIVNSDAELKEFIQSIIKLHETNDFTTLSTYISETEINANSWFSEKRFN